MTNLLRVLGILTIVAGVLVGGLLIFLAQPESAYGDVNVLLVGYGIGTGVSGVSFGLLFFQVGKIGDKVDNIVDAVENEDGTSGNSGSGVQRKCKRTGEYLPKTKSECPHCGESTDDDEHPLIRK